MSDLKHLISGEKRGAAGLLSPLTPLSLFIRENLGSRKGKSCYVCHKVQNLVPSLSLPPSLSISPPYLPPPLSPSLSIVLSPPSLFPLYLLFLPLQLILISGEMTIQYVFIGCTRGTHVNFEEMTI